MLVCACDCVCVATWSRTAIAPAVYNEGFSGLKENTWCAVRSSVSDLDSS